MTEWSAVFQLLFYRVIWIILCHFQIVLDVAGVVASLQWHGWSPLKPSGQWVLRGLYKPNPSFNHVTAVWASAWKRLDLVWVHSGITEADSWKQFIVDVSYRLHPLLYKASSNTFESWLRKQRATVVVQFFLHASCNWGRQLVLTTCPHWYYKMYFG